MSSAAVVSIVDRLKEFIRSNGKYMDELTNMIIQQKRSLVFDFPDLLLFDEALADELLENPRHVIDGLSQALKEMVKERDPAFAKSARYFHARFRRLPETLALRKVRSDRVGKLIQVEGIVVRQTPPKHLLKKVVFKCQHCGLEVEAIQDPERYVPPPSKCVRCGSNGPFSLESEKSEFVDWQKIIIQERPEELPPGQLPRSIEAVLTDDLVDSVKPGDIVTIVGVLQLNTAELKRGRAPVVSSYIDVNYVEALNKEVVEELTAEDERKIVELARQPDVIDRIVRSIAPSIYGHYYVKMGIAALLFGGMEKVFPDGTRVRGDIHVLLVGDPGTGKSQLLRWVAKISPRAIYTTGKGSSAAGLTAAVVRDKLTGEFFLEAGALVLADKGIAIIDEIEKMDAKDRVAMHEAMEQQTVSIAKAGIVAQLNARAAVLAAANPAFGRYLANRTVAENIDLPVTLLSRFDLVFIMRDEPDVDVDSRVAKHVLLLHADEVPEAYRDVIRPDLLRKYIIYARRYVKPKLGEGARNRIAQFYIEMRKKSQSPGSPIMITARQLEALVRLSEAFARMRLSPIVTEEEAELAIQLYMYFLKNVGIDVESGQIDIDVIMTGMPKSKREKYAVLREVIQKLEGVRDGPIRVEDVLIEAQKYGIEPEEARSLLELMIKNGELYSPRPGYVRRVSV